MKRSITEELIHWKNSKKRKPLLLRGARQVGKTWVMKEFGKKEFSEMIYVNFEKDKLLQEVFKQDFDIKRILLALQVFSGVVPVPGKTLLVLDEIQEVEGGLTALKYFYEDMPEFHVIGAGSLLGIALNGQSFPVGKIEFMELHPLNYSEFLLAMGEEGLLSLLKTGNWEMVKVFREKFELLLKQYFLIGGMPEAVASFVEEEDFTRVKSIQSAVLQAYEQDFSKHAPNEIVPRIRMLWNSIPSQLSKENRKFIYGLVKEGARAREYETALAWLEDYGLVHKVNRLSKVGFPLKSYTDLKAFKLYMLDIGLLCTLSGLNEKILLDGDALYTEFKGALTEQYVLQELIATCGINPYYWSEERSTGEVDFIFEQKNRFFPLEVKASENLQAKSLRFFRDKYKPLMSFRTSLSDFREESWLINVPLYGIREIARLSDEVSEAS